MHTSTSISDSNNQILDHHNALPLSLSITVFIGTLLASVIIIAGNVWMLVLIWKNTWDLLGSGITTFLNVAVADLCAGYFVFTNNQYLNNYSLCLLAYFINYTTLAVSSLSLLVATTDRYTSIKHPFFHLRW